MRESGGEEHSLTLKITMNFFFKEVVTEGHELHVNFVIVLPVPKPEMNGLPIKGRLKIN